jgi:hypothetical protein
MTEDGSLQSNAPNQARLEAAEKKIRTAWILGIISTVITLLATIAAMASPDIAAQIGFSIWNILDVLLLGGLTFGIFKKNRICAIVMFVYFIISKIIQFSAGIPNPVGIAFAALFAYGYFEGIRGTSDYQNIMRSRQENS